MFIHFTKRKDGFSLKENLYIERHNVLSFSGVKMEYYITNASGTTKVGYGNTSSPFVYNFKCN